MTESASITLKAPAKINLFLKVLGKRPDGYHDIYSLLQTVNLCDTLRLSRRDAGIKIESDSASIPVDESNLVAKAFSLLQKETGFSGGIHCKLKKEIPVGAGLGGGSSDAAAALKGINQLLGLGLVVERLAAIGANIGSDIPFFFSSGQAIISGRGEDVLTINLPTGYEIILIVPDFAISTAWAYSQLRFPLTRHSAPPTFYLAESVPDLFESLKKIGNDFQSIVADNFPEVGTCTGNLWQAGAKHVALTGSGSAFYGLFEGDSGFDTDTFIKGRIGWRVFKLRPISF
ncbi:MAG: 4-(cytidine 5'-diphospho)-2-C-methyl-D-erythritol kinase [candidate division Zixibacteria bacterium]|nr:4-(cytidine 5'-diphospho)-2-C-methyl-D-erythritol kinase [candidate division Zixibacteria bacterium]